MSSDTLSSFYAAARRLEPSEQLVASVVARAPRRPRATTRRKRLRQAVLIASMAALALTTVALAANVGILHLSNPRQDLLDANAARTSGLPSELGAPEATHLYCRGDNREIEAPVTGGDPREACAALWRQGVMSGAKQEPPALEACVATTGVITVYPGVNACAAIGRPVAKPYTPADIQAIKLSNALMAWVNATPRGCVTIAEGASKVSSMLNQMGLDNAGWRIATDNQASNGDDGKQCIVPTVFEAKKIVVLD